MTNIRKKIKNKIKINCKNENNTIKKRKTGENRGKRRGFTVMGRRDLERAGLGANDNNTANSNKNENFRVLELKSLGLEFAIFRS